MNSILVGPSWTRSVPVRRLNHAVGFRPFMSIFFRFRTLSNSHHGFSQEKKKVYQIHGNLQNPMAALQILFFNDFLTIGKCWIIKFSSEGTFKNELPKKEFGGQPHVFAETLEFHISFWLIQIQENQWHEMGGLVCVQWTNCKS